MDRGLTRQAKGDLTAALSDYDQSIALNPGDADAWFNRGIAQRVKGDFKRALADFHQAINLNPRHASAWGQHGIAKLLLGGEAAGDFAECLRLNPRLKPSLEALISQTRQQMKSKP